MRSLRLLLSIALAFYMTGAGQYGLAQDTDASPLSITLSPVQYASVNGNADKFRALNWMPNGADAGVSDITFKKDINKDISLDAQGSVFPGTDNNTGHLLLKDGDLAFLKVDYNAFRKYYDNTGGVDPNKVVDYGAAPNLPAAYEGVKGGSPNLQMDISFFKLEAGLGPVTDPFLDVTYEHNSKDGDKSSTQWARIYTSTGATAYTQAIGPSWKAVNDTADTITLKEKKEIAGVTFKGQQNAEVDYNHNITYMQFLTPNTSTQSGYNALSSENEYLDAKLFGSGVRAEKWMFNDHTYAALGYHYNHTHDTDLMQNQAQELLTGVLTPFPANSSTVNTSLWNFSHAAEDEHVLVGNFNTLITPNLTFAADSKYAHMGSDGDSTYYPITTSLTTASNTYYASTKDRQDQEGEHVALRYSGISHTSLYAESDMQQQRNWVYEDYNTQTSSGFILDRLNRTQKASWTVGGEVIPNRFFIFKTQVKQHWDDTNYDTIRAVSPGSDTFLDSLSINGIEEDSTLTWKPYRWVQNSLKYQFLNTVYDPRASILNPPSGSPSQYNVSENRMVSSIFTYDITVEPIDPLLLMLTYSHVENFVRTIGASYSGGSSAPNIPTFNSGDNSWLFSSSYTPIDNLTWTTSVSYTISSNYVNLTDGIPYGSDFRMLNFSTGLEWTYHKWLKIGPKYEHASYRDNPLSGDGSYSANIFSLTAKFSW